MDFASIAARGAVFSIFLAGAAAVFTGCGGNDDPLDGGDHDRPADHDTLGDPDGDGPSTDDDEPVIFGLEARPPHADCRAFTPPPVTDDFVFVDRFPNIELDTPTGLFRRPGDNSRTSAALSERARAYLHANCSNGHREGGTTFTPPDFRYHLPLGLWDARTRSAKRELSESLCCPSCHLVQRRRDYPASDLDARPPRSATAAVWFSAASPPSATTCAWCRRRRR